MAYKNNKISRNWKRSRSKTVGRSQKQIDYMKKVSATEDYILHAIQESYEETGISLDYDLTGAWSYELSEEFKQEARSTLKKQYNVLQDKVDELTDELTENKQQLVDLQRKLDSLEHGETDLLTDAQQNDVEIIEHEIDAITSQIKELKQEYSIAENELRNIHDYNQKQSAFDELNYMLDTIKQLENDLKFYNDEYDLIKSDNKTKVETEINETLTEIEELESTIKQQEENISRLENMIDNNSDAQNEIN